MKVDSQSMIAKRQSVRTANGRDDVTSESLVEIATNTSIGTYKVRGFKDCYEKARCGPSLDFDAEWNAFGELPIVVSFWFTVVRVRFRWVLPR